MDESADNDQDLELGPELAASIDTPTGFVYHSFVELSSVFRDGGFGLSEGSPEVPA